MGARMSGQGTRKLHEATEAFMDDFEGARWTMMRVAQIQAKMSATMDECLGEFRDMFPNPEQQLDQANQYDNLSTQIQQDLPRMMQPANSKHYDH
jgi:hypothetical protein